MESMWKPLKGTSNLAREFPEKICLHTEEKLGFPQAGEKQEISKKHGDQGAFEDQRVVPCDWSTAESREVGRQKKLRLETCLGMSLWA